MSQQSKNFLNVVMKQFSPKCTTQYLYTPTQSFTLTRVVENCMPDVMKNQNSRYPVHMSKLDEKTDNFATTTFTQECLTFGYPRAFEHCHSCATSNTIMVHRNEVVVLISQLEHSAT